MFVRIVFLEHECLRRLLRFISVSELGVTHSVKCVQGSLRGEKGRTPLLRLLQRSEAAIDGLSIFPRLDLGCRSVKFLEFNIIVFGSIKEFFVGGMTMIVILGLCDVEVWLPAQFPNHVPFQTYFRVVRDSGAFNFVFLVGVQLASRCVGDCCFILEWFIEKFLMLG